MKARGILIVVCLVGLSLGTALPQATAAFHLTKVTEVFAGQTLQPNADFVELQMYSAGQVVLSGHTLEFYAADGTLTKCTIPANVGNGTNQSHILFATAEAQTAFGTADFTMPTALISPGGGAVCFGPGVDCVTWGSFTGTVTDDKGAVTNPEGAIPFDQSIHRSLGEDGALQATDDTNNSGNDFSPGPESATANGVVNLGALTCTAGGGTTDTEKPKSTIKYPKHRSTIGNLKKLSGSAEDIGSSGVAKIEIALRQKVKGGCTWWKGGRFTRTGTCGAYVFLEAKGTESWSYKFVSGDYTFYGRYTAYSRATDKAGNVETTFEAGQNLSRFRTRGRNSAATVRG